jgi:hypothetical protein
VELQERCGPRPVPVRDDFLWMTPAMAGKTPPPTGTAWTLANVLAFLAIIAFAIAALGVWIRLVRSHLLESILFSVHWTWLAQTRGCAPR